jgi:hypothetical protein
MRFKIIYFKQIALHAKRLCEDINSLGYKCEAIEKISKESILYDDTSIYILYAAFNFNPPPKNYIVYQCEQFSSNWFTEEYWNIMRGAKQVWEYSENGNLNYDESFKGKLFYVPPGIVDGVISENKDIPVLFYGSLNKHRQNIIEGLKRKGVNVLVKNKCFKEEIVDALSKAKVVLNIHYYENGHLETFRINEALAHGCIVVSEKSTAHYPEKYNNLIYYGSNIEELSNLIKGADTLKNNIDILQLSNKQYVKKAIDEYFNS